jgi:hypothetical protein
LLAFMQQSRIFTILAQGLRVATKRFSAFITSVNHATFQFNVHAAFLRCCQWGVKPVTLFPIGVS